VVDKRVVAGQERVDGETRDTALAALLTEYADAPVAAISADGLFVPMPASVPLIRHEVLDARSALDLVVPADRVVVITAWERVRAAGASRTPVHLTAGGGNAVLHFIDVTHSHGVFVGVVVAESGEVAQAAARAASALPPRLCRVRKDELAVITSIDEATTGILGWSPEELVGRRTLELVHPEDQDRAIENWMEMLSAPGVVHRWRGRHQHRDGSWIWFEVSNANRLDDPDHADVLAEMVDLTDEMAAQEALQARERLLYTLAEALPVGVFQIDPERNVVYSNDRLDEILGTDHAVTCDAQLATVLPDARPLLDAALDAVLESGTDADVEVAVALPSTGEQRLCTMTLRALRHDDCPVEGAVVCVSDVTEAARLRVELERRATYDPLTECHNRGSVMTTLERVLVRDGRTGVAVAFVDVDGFKAVNDTLGHATGDELLTVVARRLHGAIREHDVVGRLGGDEFLVVSAGIRSAAEAEQLGARLAAALAEDVVLGAATITPRASVGVTWSDRATTFDVAATSAEMLVAEADAAMYESKADGRGEAVLFRARTSRAG
jgi:diguanylate cyclase (GGDEF)-like protein/PAS domain S-box-containing protein